MALQACHTAAMMLRGWVGPETCSLEPYEAGWAVEAMAFLYIHPPATMGTTLCLELETSADGIRWVQAASFVDVPASGGHRFRFDGFGNWLRATLSASANCNADFYWVLK
jgi:hypothetical protein